MHKSAGSNMADRHRWALAAVIAVVTHKRQVAEHISAATATWQQR